ncbi:MAG: class IV adenylate cyclase [Candidatus Moranbacteria bacterium]|nr:class IV adenylate cyclase [Candidatus Moranbacteria bacterium]
MKELKEVEVKARVSGFEEIKSKLSDLGCVFSESQTQKDRVYLDNAIEFPDKTVGTLYLRIRNSNGKNIFTLKKQLATEFECIEKELVIDDPDACDEILKLMGYHEVLNISKTRIKCTHKDMKICLDEVDRLGTFVEVEKMTTEDDTEKVKKELFEFLETLGIKKEDQIFKGYATMLYELDNK